MNKGLLEKFSGAAAAYSVRLLNRQYTGALMKIRRVDSVTSQDNGEIFVFPDNTGWVSLNSKVVDPSHASEATTLGGFVNASGYTDGDKTTIGTNTQNAYVVVWKDQSGNSNDASQGTTTAQPQIISAGALIVENGKPAVEFDGSDDVLSGSSINPSDDLTMITVYNCSSANTFNTLFGQGRGFMGTTETHTDFSFGLNGNNIQPDIQNTNLSAVINLSASTTRNKQELGELYYSRNANAYVYVDGSLGDSTTTPDYPIRNAHVLSIGAAQFTPNAKIQEAIVYNSDQSTNRIDIEEDINTAFNIYNNAPTPKKNSFLGKYPGAAAAYSTRNLTGKANQPLLKVRRELGTDTDTEETIYSSNNQLDTNQLLNFVNGVGEDPRPPLDISEGYGYSLRIVKSGYQGPLIEVRESSGNTTKDFYADSTGRINEQALLDFCGANDGHVSKWYNQSGVDRHLTSDAAANEPKIVESGVVVKDTLGNVALKFTNAGNEFLAIQDAAVFDLQEQTIAMHFMSTALPASGSKRIIGVPQASGETFDASIRNNVSISATGAIALTSQSTAVTLSNISQTVNSPSILTINFKGSDTSGTSNKTTQSTTLPTTSVKGLSVGARFTVTATPDFLTSEVIQYTSAQIGDNKNEVEASLNKQYKIYGDAYVSTWYDQSTAASDNLLLDDNPDAAAAYSLRKLRELYQGSAINVRRGSDNATKDIGFTSSGELDINELINFCSGTDGFVTTWYNQAFTSKNELLLDTVEGSGAAAAYSVRQLSSTATECMVIRRSSDGKTRTIGFRDRHIDEAAIESFCSGTTCTVQTWKDQSGNSNDATQTTPGNQPTIYTGGAIVKENGRVAVDFDGSTDILKQSGGILNGLSSYSLFSTFNPLTSATAYEAYLHQAVVTTPFNNTFQLRRDNANDRFNPISGQSLPLQNTTSAINNLHLLVSMLRNGATTNKIYQNGTFEIDITSNSYTIDAGDFAIGGRSNDANFASMKAQEFVIYGNDKSTDRTSIESNINNYYGIFSTNNAEQDVALSQPKIYDSSTGVITENGKPAVFFEAADQFDTSYQVNSNPLSVFVTAYYGGGGGQSRHTFVGVGSLTGDDSYQYFSLESWSNVGHKLWAGTGSAYDVNQISYSGNMPNTILTGIYNSSGSNLYANGTASSSNPVNTYTTGGTNYLQISHRNDTSLAKISEIVVYASDQSSRRLNIEGNINNHYRIYSLNDATQATALSQPKLVSSGRVILENGKPAVDFDGSNDKLVLSSINITNEYVSTMSVHTRSVLSVTQEVAAVSNGAAGKRRGFYYSSTNIFYASGFAANLPLRNNAPLEKVLATAFFDNANNQISGSYNGSYVSAGSYTLSDMSSPHLSIGEANDGFSAFFNGSIQEYLVYALDKSTDRIGIESNINGAFDIYWDGSKRGLLDDQPNAAAAYSVRALSSSYTGPLIEIRDGSGNTRDIYATYNGDLDETAIETFCSGTTCTVSKWYDQSGNANDASQADALSQPTIYTGGALVKEGGRLALDFDGASTYLTFSNFDFASGISAFNVYALNSSPATSHYWHSYFVKNTGGTNVFGLEFSGNTSYDTKGAILGNKAAPNDTVLVNTNQHLNTNIYDGAGTAATDVFMWEDGQSLSLTGVQNWNAIGGDSAIGWWTNGGATQYFDGKHQELIFYTSDKSTDRTNIERNINQYFNIYTDPGVDRLLNKYPGAAAAYSLRKLNSQYTGPAVRVRRDSDNVHADVYFDRTATISKYSRVGVLSSSTDPIAAASTTTLQTFMGSNNGFVAVWYDQASSNDASQSSATAQPKIYDSADGVIVENGKPAVEFIRASATKLAFTTGLSSQTNIIAIAKNTDTSWGTLVGESFAGGLRCLSSALWDSSTNNDDFYHNGSLFLDGVQLSTGTAASNVQRLIFANAASGGYTDTLVNIGEGYSGRQWSGPVQEVILYASDQSSNRTGIEDNINTFYSIY